MKFLKLLLAVALVCGGLFAITGCKTPSLEKGGAYAPTNALGQVIYSDLGLALADASYKFAYETALMPLRFERENRAQIAMLSPTIGAQVKTALDEVREEVWKIDQRWALARKAYKANPTPAGLSTIQAILSEIERLIPVIQSQLSPVYQVLSTKSLVTQ